MSDSLAYSAPFQLRPWRRYRPHMVTAAELETLFAAGHEVRSFEVKGPGSFEDKAFVARVARAAMALGNHRDGGLLCLGIDDQQLVQMTPGLGASQVQEWTDYDAV